MAKIIQEIYPGSGGLDWDTDKRFMDANDSDYRLNIIPNAFGNEYVLTNIKGNTRYSHNFTHSSDYDGAIYTCIGDCYEDNRDAVYYFIYSDLTNHSILRFNFSDNSFEKIIWDHTGIDLDIDNPITDAFFIGDWLHFNPRSSSPRAINVQWAYWDHLCYEIDGVTAVSAGAYLKFLNKVYVATQNVTLDTKPEAYPEAYDFVDYCYQDVFPLNAVAMGAVGAPGEYARFRDFYNTTTILPHPPGTEVGTDTNYEYNNIRGRQFQFSYRHYVPDQGLSIASPFTGIIAAPSSETNKGEVVGDIQQDNKITISFPVDGYSPVDPDWIVRNMLFEFVEILFREGPLDDWKVAERITHSEIAINYTVNYYEIDFYNDRSYEVIDNVSVEKQYNPLPKLAKAQWSLDGERSAYGGITEGFNFFSEVDVTMTTGETVLTLSEPDTGDLNGSYTFTGQDDPAHGGYVYTSEAIDLTDGSLAGDLLTANINGNPYTYTLTAADVLSDAAYRAAYVSLLLLGSVLAHVGGSTIIYYSSRPIAPCDTVYSYASTAAADASVKYSSFKNGAWHPFCIFYYDDALRRNEPIFSSDMRVYMETLPEVVPGDSTNYRRSIDWVLAHPPPSWAKYWRWGYAGNQTIDKFWQYNVADVSVQVKDTTDDWTRIDISPLQKIDDEDSGYNHYFPNTTIDTYSYEAGDRVRFITTNIDPPATYDLLQVAKDNRDYEILEYDDVNNYIYIDTLVGPTGAGTSTTTAAAADDITFVIELYRPKKQVGETVFYEYGDIYKVYEDGGVNYHRGGSQDQDAGNDAEGTFNVGDVWVLTRLFSLSPLTGVNNSVFIESDGWSDFHETRGWGKGKAGFSTGIGETYLNNVRYSNRYSPNTKTSGLSTFDFLDYKELSTDHGNIIAMRQAGNTLKVYFERNSAGVLVSKGQLYNADGTSQLIKSDNVLGDAVYSNYHYGTIFPESVRLKDRTVFFYDIYREAYIKDSPNGVHPISHNKMRRYFHEKSVALRSSGVSNIQVYSAYDYEYDMVYVHFVDAYDDTNNEVILFHEPQDKWATFHQISGTIVSVPTTTTTSSTTSTTSTSTTSEAYNSGLIFGHGSLRLMSYIGEDVYIHNSNSIRNNFWGAQYNSIVDFTANQHANAKKRFETICLHTNKPWDCNYVAVDADGTYADGMQSKIPESKFKLREGIYCSHYLRNMKTYSSSASILDLIRGEQLRGYYAEHRIINDDTTEVKLFKIDVRSHISRI